MKIDNAEMIKFFFKKSLTDPSLFYCRNEKCNPKRGVAKTYKQLKNKGYTNLRNHLRCCVGENFEEIYLEHLKSCCGKLDSFVYSSPKDSDIFRLIEWIIMKNQPITEVDNEITRSILNIKPISSKSLRKYILSLVPLVEDELKSVIPNKFAIMFDGWSDSNTHYVAIFATFMIKGQYHEVLLACRPLLQEDDLSADQHLLFLEDTLEVYGNSMENVICLI